MTRSSKKLKLHLSLIVLLIGIATAALLLNYYRLNKTTTKVAFDDGISGRFLNVQSLPNGLAKFSIHHDSKIVLGNDASIDSDIGTNAIPEAN